MITQYDDLEARCPRLGHLVKFHYCRSEQETMPCRRVFNCWFQRIPIQSFVQEHYDPSTVQALTAPSPDKVASLVDLIEQAQRRSEKD